ncbi:MAG: polysaccharide deacetylase family protein [Alicyclobacillus sp.]|nr:polysaccharide deacetylase family protein [Alicyclobacillus sp.]
MSCVGVGQLMMPVVVAHAAWTTSMVREMRASQPVRDIRMSGIQTASVIQTASGIRTTSDVEERLRTIAQTWRFPAIDAHVDRVWHAIPGLSGWKLDVNRSVAESTCASDGRLHLIWRSVAPARRLRDLPPEPIYRGPGDEKSAALMFNVSWGEEYVPDLLQILKAHQVHATFFLDGAWIRKHPDLTRQIAAAGHAIGSHGSGHPDFRRLSDTALARQLDETNRLISNVAGTRCVLIAPPAGAYDQRLVRMARSRGMETILWTVDTIDWRRPPARQIIGRIMAGAEPGMLVLMHPTAPTVQALPELIRGLRHRGFRFKTVEQVVREEALPPPSYLE